MPRSPVAKRARPTARTLELKEAIVASFALREDEARRRLAGFNEADWLSVLWWLDIGGMAIYALDSIEHNGAEELIPLSVKISLAQRRANNRIRLEALRHESHAVASSFESECIPYALLKGITLAPESVPESALRCQTDLDFLVAAGNANPAARILNRLGYRLHAQSGHTLEFRAGIMPLPDAANLYTAHTLRSLELHLLPERNGESNILTRSVSRNCGGLTIRALSPADILVQQALHLLKHLCGEHTRLSWVLEFRRHIDARRHNAAFWPLAESHAAQTANGDLAMAIALWVANECFGLSAEGLSKQWSAEALPVRVRLWLERYARRLLLSDIVGSKLYALLRREIPAPPSGTRSTRDILLPRVLPAPILEPRPDENFADRWDRYAAEVNFFFRRFAFHVREGARFAVESSRWNRAAARAER